MTSDLDSSIGNIDQLLKHRGRSSTPPPPNESKRDLAEMLRISYHSATDFHPKLKIATIVHAAMYKEIEKVYSAFPLLPSCLVRSVDQLQPRMIVIHRSAFQEGPWFGTEDAIGGTLVDVIRRLLPWSRKRQVPVIFIDNGLPDGFHTSHLREIGSQRLPSDDFAPRVPEGAPRSAIYEIAHRFANGQSSGPMNGNV